METRAPSSSLQLAGWREVPRERLGLELDAHYVRGQAFVLWRAAEPFAGIFATAPQRISDLEDSWAHMQQLARAGRPLAIFSDARRFGRDVTTPLTLEHMVAHYPAIGRRMRAHEWIHRAAIITPGDFSLAWWTGAIAMGFASGVRTRAFGDVAAGWKWLGAPRELIQEVAALTTAFDAGAPLRDAVRSHLLEDPLASPEATAKALGTSTRSLQRMLAQSGERFTDLRARVRLDLATRLLVESADKLDAIAASIGFRSRAHFVGWFREATGRTPTQFRKQSPPLTPR